MTLCPGLSFSILYGGEKAIFVVFDRMSACSNRWAEFITVSGRNVCIESFIIHFNRMVLQSTEQDESALPTCHTCFSTLAIPSGYSSREILEKKLKMALQHHEGFGFV